MKKNQFMQTMAALLCFIMLCSTSAYAAETRASERIDRSSVTLSKKSNGDLSISFSVRATGSMDVLGATSLEVQRYTTSGWSVEYTYTPGNTPELQVKNKIRHDLTLTYSPLYKGEEYRAVVIIYAEDASGSSSKQLTSRTVT